MYIIVGILIQKENIDALEAQLKALTDQNEHLAGQLKQFEK